MRSENTEGLKLQQDFTYSKPLTIYYLFVKMPEYIYQHPDSEEYKLILQGINDVHEYIDDEGVKWNRIFTTPQVSTVGSIDPFSQNDFVNKTAQKKGLMVI